MPNNSGLTGPSLRILICVPFRLSDPKGNSVAASRLRDGFHDQGASVEILDFPDIGDPDRIRAVAARFRPQVVLVLHAWRCAKAASILGSEWKTPQVVSMRGTDLNEMLDDPVTRDTLTRVLDTSAAIAVFRSAAKDRLWARKFSWRQKTVVIPNGVHLDRSNVLFRQRLGIPTDAFVFGSVCGLRQVKRPLMVLPWISRMRHHYPQIIWMHAGQPLEAEIAAQLQTSASNQDWIFHLDHIPHSEMDSFFRAMDVFLSASRSEGMPHAVREAMLSGRSCLLSDIEGHRAVADENRQALFFRSEDDFLAHARQLIEDPTFCRFLGSAAEERILREQSECTEISSYMRLFSTLCSASKETTR